MYQVGDRVRIVSKAPANCSVGITEAMERRFGTVMTIRRVRDYSYRKEYYMVEDELEYFGNAYSGWAWSKELIEGLKAPTVLHFDSSPFYLIRETWLDIKRSPDITCIERS